MSEQKVMPEWCKKLSEHMINCYVSDYSDEQALRDWKIRSIVSYNSDVDNEYNFSAINGVLPKTNKLVGWKFAVPVDPAVRSCDQRKAIVLKLITDLKAAIYQQEIANKALTTLQQGISEWYVEPSELTKKASWRDNIPAVGVYCYVSCHSEEYALEYCHTEAIYVYEPGGEFSYRGERGKGWRFAVPVDPKLRDEVPE